MESEKSSYEFEQNLLTVSSSSNIDDAIKEWAEITTKKTESKETCICNRKINNLVFMYNSLTNKTIMVGTGCYKKFGLNTGFKTIHPVLKSILIEFLEKGEYDKIKDILLYCEHVKTKLKEYYYSKLEDIDKLEALETLKEEVLDLINKEGLSFMSEILKDIDNKIGGILAKRIKEIIDREEEIKQRQLDDERRKQEEIKQRQERECGCGIEFINICKCEKPQYKTLKINQELYCELCRKWKCRCTDY